MKGHIYALVVILGLVLGLFLLAFKYGQNTGRNNCERRYEQRNAEIVNESEKKENAVKNTVNSADIDRIRWMLCENARGGCNTKRADN